MGFKFGKRSHDKLLGIHPDLIAVMDRAIELTEIDFAITEGVRTEERQKALVASGASTTMRSRHLTGHAVDVAAFLGKELRWDWPLYGKIAEAVKAAAKEVGVPVEWGGDWKSFPDGPHFQLPWRTHP